MVLQSDTLCTQREVEARVEQVTARYEERIIELHSVIAELRKKLERHHINVIRSVSHTLRPLVSAAVLCVVHCHLGPLSLGFCATSCVTHIAVLQSCEAVCQSCRVYLQLLVPPVCLSSGSSQVQTATFLILDHWTGAGLRRCYPRCYKRFTPEAGVS